MSYFEFLRTIGAAFGTKVKPAGGIDPSGNAKALSLAVDGSTIISATAPIAVSTTPSGAVAGFTFGDITTVATSRVGVRRTAYTEQTSNAQRSIVSSSANDTAAGTGAQTVTLTYYAISAGVVTGPFTEVVTLNGTTPVNTVATNICFYENVKVSTVGSTGSNVGTLTLKAATAGGGATIGTIDATDNQTFWCHQDRKSVV
jgi:hypothetical protein